MLPGSAPGLEMLLTLSNSFKLEAHNTLSVPYNTSSHRLPDILLNIVWEPAFRWGMIISQPHPSIGGGFCPKIAIKSHSSVFPLAMPLIVRASRRLHFLPYTASNSLPILRSALTVALFCRHLKIPHILGGRCDQSVSVTAWISISNHPNSP